MMSFGPAVTMSEGNIENISTSAIIFGATKSDCLKDKNQCPSQTPEIRTITPQTQNCVSKSEEKPQIKATDIPNCGPNHVLRPAKIENINVHKQPMPTSGKPQAMSNYIIENKLPTRATIGAAGDGFPQNEKIMLLKNQNNAPPPTNQASCNTKDPELPMVEITSENARYSHTSNTQTYAKAAQNSPKSYERNLDKDPPPLNPRKEDENASTTTLQKNPNNNPSVNGVLEDPPLQMPTPIIISQASTDSSDNKAIKETIGHVSKFPDEYPDPRTTGNDVQPNEQEIQILSNPEMVAEYGSPDILQMEGSFAKTDIDVTLSSKLGSGPPRREAEKPPRMQKQRSQDRLLIKQQKPSFDSDMKRETLSRESSVECVDSTGVDVHEFLITTLRNSTRDRAILLKIEHDMIAFVNNKTIDFMKFPPMTSYHRMLVHRVAAYFGMDHNVDETGRSVIINKTSSTRLPEVRFADQFDPRQPEQHSSRREDDMRRRSILKRTNQSRSFDRDDIKGGTSWKDRQRSIEEREEQYEKVRARIFNNPEANMNSPSIYGRRGISSLAAARMACWTDRPWNSTDMEPVTSGLRMPGPRPLTTRASSYSSISVLPRHNSVTSVKTGSSSSVSSMNGVNNGMHNFSHGRQPQNMGNPRPPTPSRRNGASGMGENNNGTYYYMQQQNQDLSFDAVEDDIAQSWFPESPEPSSMYNTEYVVPTDTPIVLAVPYGTTLPPETVLCHPLTGMPYLSPEGYQLVYQSGHGPAVSGGMTSPQFARYYQMPPQPSAQHPGMPYTQGYNPYDESPQKAAQGSNSTEYTMISPMSSYPPNISSTSTVYSAVQGQPNISYTYQPANAVYRSTPDQTMGGTAASQPGMQVHQVAPITVAQNAQGKRTPVMQGGQNFVHHQQLSATPTYPPYVVTQPVNSTGPLQGGSKDGVPPHHLPGAVTPRTILTQPAPGMQQVPPMYPQQPMQVVFSPPTANVAASPGVEVYHQNMQNEPPKSSNQAQELKKTTEDELNEKMQAIVLKNLQQQQRQLPDSVASESANTVTTSLSPSSTNPIPKHHVPEVANQSRMTTVVNPSHQHRHPSETHGYQYHYTNTNGMPHPQQMQVYLMPTNAPGGGTSYRTYSQFMTQPQTPHVMGPGMHFVYLSPPMSGMVGMEGHGTMTAPPSVQVIHTTQMGHPGRQLSDTMPTYTSNTNNNNNVINNEKPQPYAAHTYEAKPSEVSATIQDSSHAQTSNMETLSQTTTEALPNQNSDNACAEENSTQNDTHASAIQSSSSNENGGSIEATSTTESEPVGKYPSPVTGPSPPGIGQSHTTSVTPTNNIHTYHMHGPHVMQHANTPVLLSNVQQDYRITGMNMTSPVSYPTGVVPQYSMYPNISPSPYVYLPAAATARSPKLPDIKMFPTQAAHGSRSPGLIAVQLPNQNQIQLVPAASLTHQSQLYYAPHNYMTTDYTSQAQVPVQNITYPAKQEVLGQTNTAPQVNENVAAEIVTLPPDNDIENTTQVESCNNMKSEDPSPELAKTSPDTQ